MSTKRLLMLFILFSSLLISNIKINTYAQHVEPNNTKINVQVLQTLPNGTYVEYPAFMAYVKLTYKLSPNIQYNGTTDENGFVTFTVNTTGTYTLEINYPDAIFEPKDIYIRADTFNYFYEKVYRLATFFGGNQETIVRQVELHLRCSLVLTFPRAVNINGTVKSYAGLRSKTYQGDTMFTVEFLDICTPILDPKTGLYKMTNYTVTLKIDQTIESGFVTLTLVSNGTVLADFSKLYYLPEGVSAQFQFVVQVTPLKYVEEFQDIQEKLNKIIDLLLKIIDMINGTVIPKLDKIDTKIVNSTLALVRKINNSTTLLFNQIEKKMINSTLLNVIYEKIKKVDSNVKYMSGTLNIFVNDFPYQIQNILTQSSNTLGTDTTLSIVLFIILCILIYVRTRKTGYTEKGGYVITT